MFFSPSLNKIIIVYFVSLHSFLFSSTRKNTFFNHTPPNHKKTTKIFFKRIYLFIFYHLVFTPYKGTHSTDCCFFFFSFFFLGQAQGKKKWPKHSQRYFFKLTPKNLPKNTATGFWKNEEKATKTLIMWFQRLKHYLFLLFYLFVFTPLW